MDASVQALTPRLVTVLAPLRLSTLAVRLAIKLASTRDVPSTVRVTGSVKEEIAAAEVHQRAAYLVAAASRIDQNLRTGTSSTQALLNERRFFAAHLAAGERRKQMAGTLATAQRKYGQELGWYATLDHLTSEECRAANGTNFNVGEPPDIGYPGMAHPTCRCKPGPPFKSGEMTYSIRRQR